MGVHANALHLKNSFMYCLARLWFPAEVDWLPDNWLTADQVAAELALEQGQVQSLLSQYLDLLQPHLARARRVDWLFPRSAVVLLRSLMVMEEHGASPAQVRAWLAALDDGLAAAPAAIPVPAGPEAEAAADEVTPEERASLSPRRSKRAARLQAIGSPGAARRLSLLAGAALLAMMVLAAVSLAG